MIRFSETLTANPVRFSRPIVFSSAVENRQSGSDRDPQRVALARAHYEKRQAVIARFLAAINRHLEYAKHETLRKLEEKARASRPAKRGARRRRHRHHVRSATVRGRPFHRAAQRVCRRPADCRRRAARGVGYTDPWSMPDPIVRAFIETRQNLLSGVPDEIFTAIEDEISQGVGAGESISDLAKRITAGFDNVSRGRATTIASTETGAAYGFSRQHAMEKAGVKHKNWLTSHLPNVRLAHWQAELNPENQRIPLDQPFDVGGEASHVSRRRTRLAREHHQLPLRGAGGRLTMNPPFVIQVELPEDARSLIKGLEAFPEKIVLALKRGIDKALPEVASKIQADRLTGQGPFPIEEHMLGVRSGQLRQSVRFTAGVIDGDTVIASIGSPLRYAAVHEFGFEGDVQVKPFFRKNRPRGSVRKNRPRLATDWPALPLHRQNASGVSPVKAHSRHMKIPARSPFGYGVADSDQIIINAVTSELQVAWASVQ
jgi:phage gpG-like protein